MDNDYKIIDLAIVGGGCAGLSAALTAYENGIKNIMIFERNEYLGGILTQCIHNGFGIHRYQKDLTGTQYANKLISSIKKENINFLTGTTILEVSKNKTITAINKQNGIITYQAKAIIFATGCRERSRGALLIPGSRPAGIITAGTAQKYLNIDGYLVGKEIIILGSGDIGLIMARQFVLEGAHVSAVAEIKPYSVGLIRNIVQCLDDFDIPIYYSTTITNIIGDKRIEGVYLAEVNEKNEILKKTERYMKCDTLVLSVGLIPENELIYDMGLRISPQTNGPIVDDTLQTEIAGIFICGNSLHVHDLADFASMEGEEAGKNAAQYILNKRPTVNKEFLSIICGKGISHIIPQRIQNKNNNVKLQFRSNNKFYDKNLIIYSGEKIIKQKKYKVITPGEMCHIEIDKTLVKENITLEIK